MSKNTPAERLYFEIADAIDLLDNVTAATDRDADDLGQAELALVRAREIILKTSLRLIDEAPAMLAALRDAMEELQAWRSKYHPIQWPDKPVVHTATRDKIRAILSRIDGAPTAQPAGDDPAITAAANLSRAALVEAAGEALALQAPISEAGERCASCGAEEGESHGAQCEARAFAAGADARRLDTGALRTVAGDDAAWLEATASRDGGEC